MIARFGRYEAIEVLGRGGMGVVYRGVDTVIGRTVAVKTVLLDEAGRGRAGELHERLIREVKAAGLLQHPNIITVHDVGIENGTPYIVMELIQGRGLDKVLEESTPPVEESLRILRVTARALDFAHRRGVVHRDIKPSNILIATDGMVKLVDFGIAKVAGTETITEKGAVVGSVPFMAPESLRGEPSSASSDRYSLAVMAYAMMTGRMPFQAETIGALITAILTTEPPAARQVNPRLLARVDAVLARGFAKSAAARYESCATFVDALDHACRPAAAPPPPARPLQPKVAVLPPTVAVPLAKRSLRPVVIGGAALAGIALAGWLVWTRPDSPPLNPTTAPAPQSAKSNEPLGSKKIAAYQPPRSSNPSPPKVEQRKEAEKSKPETKDTKERSDPPKTAASEPLPSEAPPPKIEQKSVAKDTPESLQTVSGRIRQHPNDGLKYVWIPPGRFQMGCSAGDTQCDDDEKPARDVEVTRGFWIGQTEVTQEAYQKMIGTNPSYFKGTALPVETVSWTEANFYCKTVGMRLPTEAEWEHAARGGSTAAPRYGVLEKIAWFGGNGGSRTHVMAEKQPNGLGLYDVLGNVWEWVTDWYDAKYYTKGKGRDPSGPSSGQKRVVRGGSWVDRPQNVRLSERDGAGPTGRGSGVGFRCAGELR